MIRLTDKDWELLFISRDVMIGKTKITVKPMGIAALAAAIPSLASVFSEFQKRKSGKADKADGDILAEMAGYIAENATDVLSVACGLHPDDIMRLPGAKVLELAIAALDVNLKAQAGLEKNLQELPEILKSLTGKKAE